MIVAAVVARTERASKMERNGMNETILSHFFYKNYNQLSEEITEGILDAGNLDYLNSPSITLDALKIILGDDDSLKP